MNLKKRVLIGKLNRIILGASIQTPTSGSLSTIDNEVFLDINGLFRVLVIHFKGDAFIYNELNDGYAINMSNNRIIITNFMAKGLNPNGFLFRYKGVLNIEDAEIRTFVSTRVGLSVSNETKLQQINTSMTNIEDETIIFQHSQQRSRISEGRFIHNKVNDTSIKGLYSETLFGDSYSGYYYYHPEEKVYMTGKVITNKSTPIGEDIRTIKSSTRKQMLNRVYNKMAKTLQPTKPSRVVKEEDIAPLKEQITKSGEVIKKIKKGGKY